MKRRLLVDSFSLTWVSDNECIVFERCGLHVRALRKTPNHERPEIKDIGHPVVEINACHCVSKLSKRISARVSASSVPNLSRTKNKTVEGSYERGCWPGAYLQPKC